MENYQDLSMSRKRREALKAAVSAWAGTALEFYDFIIFGYLALILAPLFFPSSNPTVGFIKLFAVFGAGFVMRPFGAVLFGWVGDKHLGRRNTLMITIFLMGGVSLGMGLLPTYAQIGVASTVLIVLFRLIQGLALGGEYGGGISLTAELSPSDRRGRYIGIAQMAQGGFIPSSLVAIFTRIMTHAQLVAYGWRILFILGVVIAIVGILIRLRLSKSPYLEQVKEQNRTAKVPLARAWAKYPTKMLFGIFIVAGATVITYTFSTYGITYLKLYEGFSLAESSLILSIATGMFMVLTPLWAYLSDRIGRKPFMILTPTLLLIFVYPFYVLLGMGALAVAIGAYMMAYLFYSLWNGSYAAVLSEIFPTEIRYTGVSFSYNFAVGIFGGFSPLIVALLITTLHSKLAPIVWLVPFLFIALILVVFVYKEAKGVDLAKIDAVRSDSIADVGEVD